mmetsp:Transcript_7184/g.23801  ORF Transcript_7184/g.23801 Transcript_7184/m.23801 type:complete len:399 (+) Transcript_7184:3775-4971(+)
MLSITKGKFSNFVSFEARISSSDPQLKSNKSVLLTLYRLKKASTFLVFSSSSKPLCLRLFAARDASSSTATSTSTSTSSSAFASIEGSTHRTMFGPNHVGSRMFACGSVFAFATATTGIVKPSKFTYFSTGYCAPSLTRTTSHLKSRVSASDEYSFIGRSILTSTPGCFEENLKCFSANSTTRLSFSTTTHSNSFGGYRRARKVGNDPSRKPKIKTVVGEDDDDSETDELRDFLCFLSLAMCTADANIASFHASKAHPKTSSGFTSPSTFPFDPLQLPRINALATSRPSAPPPSSSNATSTTAKSSSPFSSSPNVKSTTFTCHKTSPLFSSTPLGANKLTHSHKTSNGQSPSPSSVSSIIALTLGNSFVRIPDSACTYAHVPVSSSRITSNPTLSSTL